MIVPLALWLALMVARASRALLLNRIHYPAGLGRTVLRLLLIVPILAVIDLATFAGTAQWLLLDALGKPRS